MLSSDFKFWVKLFSLYKTWSNDLGRVFFERYRKIKKMESSYVVTFNDEGNGRCAETKLERLGDTGFSLCKVD